MENPCAGSADPLLDQDASDAQDAEHNQCAGNAWGMALYASSSIFLTVQLSCAHDLGRHGTPVFVIIAVREAIITALAGFALLCHRLFKPPLKPQWIHRWRLLALRAVLGAAAICCSLWAVTLLDLGVNMVLTALTPAWVALLSPLALREQPSRLSLCTISVCLVAVGFVAKPALHDHKFGQQATGISLALVQSLLAAAAKLLVRELRSTESPHVLVLALSSFTLLLSAAAVSATTGWLAGWHAIVSPLLIAGIGVFGYLTQTAITFALRHTAAAPAVAMSYLSVVSGIAGGYVMFGEVPPVSTVIGGALICLSTLTLAVHER